MESKTRRLWPIAALTFSVTFLPALVMVGFQAIGHPVPESFLRMLFGAVGIVIAPLLLLRYRKLFARLWLMRRGMPRDDEAVRAIAYAKRPWRSRHPLLFLASQRFAARRANGGDRRSALCCAWVAEAYGDAGGTSEFDLFEILGAFQHTGGWMDEAHCAVVKAVGMKHVVAVLRDGVRVGTMVSYIRRFGINRLEQYLEAGIPFEYMEAVS